MRSAMRPRPGRPGRAGLARAGRPVTTAHVEELLETACAAYEAVVVDAGSSLDERTLAGLEAAEVVVLPIYPEIAALKAVHSFLDFVNETARSRRRPRFVLNGLFARNCSRCATSRAASGRRSRSTLPHDPFLYLKAVNEGSPVVIGAARTPVAAAMLKLAAAAFGSAAAESRAPVEDKKSRGLGGLLKRN